MNTLEERFEEIWKDIKGYKGLYQVSNYGRIKSLKKNIILKGFFTGKYMVVRLYKQKSKDFKIHRIVAQEFMRKPKKGQEINHIDGNKLNNKVTNLEWVSHSENLKHAYKMGLQKVSKEQRRRFYQIIENSKTKVKQIDVNNGDVIKVWNGIREASRNSKTSYNNILKVLNGEAYQIDGFRWEKVK